MCFLLCFYWCLGFLIFSIIVASKPEDSPKRCETGLWREAWFRNRSISHSLHLWVFVSVVMPVSLKGSVGYRCPFWLHNHEYHRAHKEPRFFQLWHLWWQSGSGHRGRVSMVMAQLLLFLRIMVTVPSHESIWWWWDA